MEPENSVLMVVANKDFRDEEYSIPYTTLSENGVSVKIAAADPGDCIGIGGTTVAVDYTLDEINSDQYGAVLFVGGSGVELYFSNDLALGLVQEFFNQGKYVCAICWATTLLARAGILQGKKVTAWEGAKADIEAAGATFTGNPMEIDGNIITANGPDAADQFAHTITDLVLGQA